MIDPLDINIGEGDEGGDGTEVSLTEVLEETMVKALQSMAGPVIGKVDSYDSASARVSITPLVPLLVDGEVVASPKLPSVPVAWPRSSTHAYTFPLGAGSYMELIPLGHDHSRWLVAGTEGQPPSDDRRFSLSDLVALPLAPSPQSAPLDPTSYDSAWAVLFGQHKVGSASASLSVALNKDNCPADTNMALWMSQVEAFINGLAIGTVAPLSTVFNSTAISTVTASAAKLKAE